MYLQDGLQNARSIQLLRFGENQAVRSQHKFDHRIDTLPRAKCEIRRRMCGNAAVFIVTPRAHVVETLDLQESQIAVCTLGYTPPLSTYHLIHTGRHA
jgi:hypothetical protein